MSIFSITDSSYYKPYYKYGQPIINHRFEEGIMQDNLAGNTPYKLVLSGLMISLIILGTIIFRIPVPMTQGYVHLGDAMIYLSVFLLGKKQGALAAGLGSALGDILGGYAFWAPWTFIIKFAMAYATGAILAKPKKSQALPEASGQAPQAARKFSSPGILAMITGGLVMCAGYLIAERVIYGSWTIAAIALPWNTGQFVTGITVTAALQQTIMQQKTKK